MTVELKEANSANTNFWKQQGRNALNSQQIIPKRSTSVCTARDNTEIAAAQAAAQTQTCMWTYSGLNKLLNIKSPLFSTASAQSNARCGRKRHHVSSERKAPIPCNRQVGGLRCAQRGKRSLASHPPFCNTQLFFCSKTQLTHDTRCTTRHETALVIWSCMLNFTPHRRREGP